MRFCHAESPLPNPLPALPGEGTRRRAFTLVELLVVIGIIAVLIGILLPALGRANQLAKRTVCSSNLREVYMSLRLYANDNRDASLLGWRKTKAYTSTLWSNTANTYTLFGWLYPTGYMKQPRVWYCPTEADPKYAFNVPASNPWPPGPPAHATQLTNAGYGCRPDYELLDSGPGVYAPNTPGRYTRLSAYTNKAIFGDLMNGSAKIATRHVRGVNVLYGDGHVRWVERGAIDPYYSRLPVDPTPIPNSNMAPDEYAVMINTVWDRLDRQ